MGSQQEVVASQFSETWESSVQDLYILQKMVMGGPERATYERQTKKLDCIMDTANQQALVSFACSTCFPSDMIRKTTTARIEQFSQRLNTFHQWESTHLQGRQLSILICLPWTETFLEEFKICCIDLLLEGTWWTRIVYFVKMAEKNVHHLCFPNKIRQLCNLCFISEIFF